MQKVQTASQNIHTNKHPFPGLEWCLYYIIIFSSMQTKSHNEEIKRDSYVLWGLLVWFAYSDACLLINLQ